GVNISHQNPPVPIKLLSYADDLEVFLSCTNEWPALLHLLQLYGRASNGKVNLSKTVLVSLSGVAHSSWQSIVTSENLEWHTSSSLSAVRYLGYPLYSTDMQLKAYLNEIKIKMVKHSNILKGRYLSVRALLLKPSLWKVFWSLKMSAKAFTPWWRLLHNSIGHRTKLHRWSSTHFDTPVCGICSRENESLYHFSVGCIRKSNFWMDVYTALDKPEFLSSEMAVWTALTSLSQLDNSHCSPEDLAILGCAFSSLWKYHWRSVID
ncbi:hypothetical protein BDB01DRAFT_706195, partial [Pilobolus umbonatus]